MKPKLKNIQEALKILEKDYEIPKQWYRVKFPKTIKRKKKIDTIWKDYTIVLFAKRWIYACGNAIANKIRVLIEEPEDGSYGDGKEGSYDSSYRLLKSLTKGFGISKIGGKHYLQNEFDEKEDYIEDFIPWTKNIPLNIEKQMTLNLASYGIDKKEIPTRTIIKLPEKIDTAKTIVEGEFYWKQWFKLYKNKSYRNKLYERPADVLKNNNILRKETRTLYKRYMKIRKEKKYNLKFFVNYNPKNKKFWTSNWNLFSQIK